MANPEKMGKIFGWELFEGLTHPPVREEDVLSQDAGGGFPPIARDERRTRSSNPAGEKKVSFQPAMPTRRHR